MNAKIKDVITKNFVSMIGTLIVGLLMFYVGNKTAKAKELKEEIESKANRIEVIDALDEKLDKKTFEDYKESENKKDEMILDILKDIQQKQNQQIKRTDDILINISKIK